MAMTNYLLPVLVLVVAALAGGLSGLLAVKWLLSRCERQEQAAPTDPFVAAQIDQAAVNWATAQGKPEAAGLMADKLRLLHQVSQRRGWWRP
jgi:hypothetical protein